MLYKPTLTYLIFIVLFLSNSIQAQYKPHRQELKNLPKFDEKSWHWGYILGVNIYDFKIAPSSTGFVKGSESNQHKVGIKSKVTTGFTVGLLGDFKLNEYFHFRIEPGLNYTTRFLYYDKSLIEGFGFDINDDDNLIREIHSTYVSLPLLIKAVGKRRGNVNPYIIGGITPAINLTLAENKSDDNTTGRQGFRTKNLMFAWDAGAGLDWYLPFFRLTTEVRATFGVLDEMVEDGNPPGSVDSPWTGSIDYLKTRGVFLVLKFE
ncbi:MAG: PorT family protein [Ichthyobacteriaceae bacterium]|nr:PorT family protein [Ichthyobacteriaceae bacterium]